jgi:hypothetical protein
LKLHGDEFFDMLDKWLVKLDLGTDLPRDEITVRQSMANVVVKNPVFSELAEEAQFKNLAEKLENNCRNN